MTFKWENFSKTLLRDLARAANLRVSFASTDLAKSYGLIPGEQFVQDLWLVLRDRWLASSPGHRLFVVDALRAEGLGDSKTRVGTKASQMAYLKSCRQSGGLRTAVLAAFVDAGSVDTSRPVGAAQEPAGEDGSAIAVERVFAALEDQSCARMEFIIVQGIVDALNKYGVPCADARTAAAYMASNVEVAIASSLLDETELDPPSSPAREQLIRGAKQIAAEHRVIQLRSAITEFGEAAFSDPTNKVDSLLIYAYSTILSMIATGDLQPDPKIQEMMVAEVAWMCQVITQTSGAQAVPPVNAVAAAPEPNPDPLPPVAVATSEAEAPADDEPHEGFLRRLFGRRTDDDEVRVQPAEPIVVPPAAAPAVASADVRTRLAEYLTALFGEPPKFDEDGDIPIVTGSAIVFLRLLEREQSLPFLMAFSTLVRDVPMSPTLYECVVEAQMRMRVGRLAVEGNVVRLEIVIPAGDLTLDEVGFILSEATGAADCFDTLLAQKFGGQLAFADAGDVIEA